MKIRLIPEPQVIKIISHAEFQTSSYGEIFLQYPAVYQESDDISRLSRQAGNFLGPITVTASDQRQDSYFYLFSYGKTSMPPKEIISSEYKKDSYDLIIDEEGFILKAHTAAGLFYGMQTLKQLLKHKEIYALQIIDWADMDIRADYLDLRTIFPPFDRILYFIKELSYYKINTLVIEYEDKLPFKKSSFLRHNSHCFSDAQFSLLLETAKEYHIDIIPLQQSFGHLEYVLKHDQYKYLRETPEHPGEMCPLRQGAAALSYSLLEETASLHPDSRYLHIGCDEVWSLGQSTECRESGKSRELIFIEYVNKLIEHVCSLGKIPVIWHDMFAHADKEELAILDKRVLVAVWLYNGSNMPVKAIDLIKRLESEGISCLGCSSVRCWDNKPEQNYPDIDNRLLNLELWGKTISNPSVHINGLIHTNWASSFSFGRPYGLFETSRYPLVYGASLSWNIKASRDEFLYSFLFLYHEIDPSEQEQKCYQNRDYYLLMPKLSDRISHNKETAQFIALMLELENSFPVSHTLFRLELYPDSEVEYACIKERSVEALKKLDRVESRLRDFIPAVLDPDMSELFIMSRLYLYKLAKDRLDNLLSDHERNLS